MQLPNYNSASGEKPPLGGTIVLLAFIAAMLLFYAHRTGSLSKVTLIALLVLIPSVILHEISHGWLANAFGDQTAKRAGRLTLNPLRHADPLGTFIVPGVLLLTGASSAFGWAKPVPVETSRMSRNKAMLVGLVGPATNIVILALTTIAIHIVYNSRDSLSDGVWQWTMTTLLLLGRINIVLAIFNLLPIPPLDGSSVVERFLPQKYMYQYLQFRKYAIFLLLILMLAAGRIFSFLFDPAIRFWIENFMPFEVF
jgi:Zn-dependent protease